MITEFGVGYQVRCENCIATYTSYRVRSIEGMIEVAAIHGWQRLGGRDLCLLCSAQERYDESNSGNNRG